jgi:hypothetical protein
LLLWFWLWFWLWLGLGFQGKGSKESSPEKCSREIFARIWMRDRGNWRANLQD